MRRGWPNHTATCYSKRFHLKYLELTCWICTLVNALFLLGVFGSQVMWTLGFCWEPEAGRHHSVKVLELLTQNCMPHFSQSPAGDLVQAKGPLWTMLSSPYHGRKSSLSRWLVRNIRWNDMSLLCLYYHVKPKGTVAESAGSGNGMTGFKSQLCHLKLCLWTSYLTF